MASAELSEIIARAEKLPREEQMQLIAHLAERASHAGAKAAPRRRWSEIRGMAPYPLVGEDAQAWVTRTRRESDEGREKQWRGER